MLFCLSHRDELKRWICYISSFYFEKFPDSRIAGTVHWFKSLVFPTTQKLFLYVKFWSPYSTSKFDCLFFYTPCILIIHSGPVARTVPIKNHGQDSSTSQLESTRFKYIRLKKHLKELRTCPECKNRYAKHTCIGVSHGAIFLAT